MEMVWHVVCGYWAVDCHLTRSRVAARGVSLRPHQRPQIFPALATACLSLGLDFQALGCVDPASEHPPMDSGREFSQPRTHLIAIAVEPFVEGHSLRDILTSVSLSCVIPCVARVVTKTRTKAFAFPSDRIVTKAAIRFLDGFSKKKRNFDTGIC